MQQQPALWLSAPPMLPTLASTEAALSARVNPHSGRIISLSPELGVWLGARVGSLIGGPLTQLWPAEERAVVARQLEEAVLVGRAAFSPLTVSPESGSFLALTASGRYEHRGAEYVEVSFTPSAAQTATVSDTPTWSLGASHSSPTAPPAAETGMTSATSPWPTEALDAVLPPPAPGFAAVLGEAPAIAAQKVEPAADLDRPTGATGPIPAIVAPAVAPVVSSRPAPSYGLSPELLAKEGAVRAESSAEPDPSTASVANDPAVRLALAALDAANVIAVVLGSDGRIAAVTGSFRSYVVTGLDPVGHRLGEWITFSAASSEALDAARREGSSQSVRVELPRKGQTVIMEWLPAGQPGAGLGIFTTTPNAEQAEQLRIQAQVVAQISHDVRDQLSAIGSGLNTLLDQLPFNSSQREYVERLRGEASRAINIVKDGLDFARPGCSTPTCVALDELLGETLDHYRPRAAARGVALSSPSGVKPVLMGDRTGLARIFSNLIDNALHAMPYGGVLTIGAAPEARGGAGWRLTVADTGVGMKPERLATIFDPAVSHRQGGTGLGLAITRRYVVDHGGQINVDSQEGRGTTFTIWLPEGDLDAEEGADGT